jgi:hypothetical protein
MSQLRALHVFFVSLVLMSAIRVDATIIVLVPKQDAIWVGSDGLRTDTQNYSMVCKLHEAFGGVLLKFGNDKDNSATYSTDEDIRKLIATKKSFADFQQFAANILRARVDIHLKETIKALKDDPRNIGFFDGENTVAEPWIPPEVISDLLVGLVFVDSEEGELKIHEVLVAPSLEAVTRENGEPGFRWVVNVPIWSIDESKKPNIYGAVLIGQSGTMVASADNMLADPEKIPSLLPAFGDYLNSLHPENCAISRPYTVLKITAHTLDPQKRYSRSAKERLLNTVSVDYKSRGNCPSWQAIHISRPTDCPQ